MSIYEASRPLAQSTMKQAVPVESEREFRSKVVRWIIEGRPEDALRLLSEFYDVSQPELRVGTVKRHRGVVALYVEKEHRIYLSKSDYVSNPFVILHEFYHHLRATQATKKKQADKRADLFANNFLSDYRRSIANQHFVPPK
jgi:hypothetical protein